MSNRKTIPISNNAGKRKQKYNAVENQPKKSLKLEKLEDDPGNEDEVLLENENVQLPPKLLNPSIKEDEILEVDNVAEKPIIEANDGLLENDNLRPRSEDSLEKNENEEKKCTDFYMMGYCTKNNNSDEFYAKNENDDEMYYSDEDGMRYASKTIKINNEDYEVEYPITLKDGKQEYIYQNGIPKYPENLRTAKIRFPKDPVTNEEVYLENENGEINYPKNKYGEEFYRKDAEGNEVPIDNIYRKDSDGTEIYPRDNENNEFYLRDESNKVEIGAFKNLNNLTFQYYARKANGDEFYPRRYF